MLQKWTLNLISISYEVCVDFQPFKKCLLRNWGEIILLKIITFKCTTGVCRY